MSTSAAPPSLAAPRGAGRPWRKGVLAVLLLGLSTVARAGEQARWSARVLARGDVEPRWVEEAVRLGEALWTELRARFGRAPDASRSPLALRLFPDVASFRVACPDAPADARAFTTADGAESLAWIQAEEFDTRRAILRALTRQFLQRTFEHATDAPAWYLDGIAEHHGWHRRLPGGVRFGAFQAIASDPRASDAARRAASAAFPAWDVATGRLPAAPADGTILVETLVRSGDERLRDAFRAWEAEALAQGDDGTRFALRFTGLEDELGREVRAVWSGFRRSWTPLAPGWDEDERGISGLGGLRPALLRWSAEAPAQAVEADVERGRALGAGVVLALRAPGSWVCAEVRAGRLVVVRASSAGERELAQRRFPGAHAPDVIHVRLAREGASLRVDAAGLQPLIVSLEAAGLAGAEVGGDSGLLARGGTVRFRAFRSE